MDFDAEMPPAPKIDRSGIVVTDITEGFLDAAMSMFFFGASGWVICLMRVLLIVYRT